MEPPRYGLDLIFLRRTETQGGDDGFAVEEIRTAGIDDNEMRYSKSFGFLHGLRDPVEVSLKTDFRAGSFGMLGGVFRAELWVRLKGLDIRPQVGVTRLRSGFAWSHAQVFANDGVETESGVLRE